MWGVWKVAKEAVGHRESDAVVVWGAKRADVEGLAGWGSVLRGRLFALTAVAPLIRGRGCGRGDEHGCRR